MAWLSGWLYRKKITPPIADSLQTGFPITINIVADTDIGGNAAFADCRDFRLTAADGATLLPWMHVTPPAIVAGECDGLIRTVTDVSATVDSPIYLYYGNAAASANDSSSLTVSDLEIAWDLETEDPPDWSGNGWTGTGYGNATSYAAPLSDAVTLDGVNDYVAGGASTGTTPTSPFHVSGWVRFDTVAGGDYGYRTPFSKYNLNTSKGCWYVALNTDTSVWGSKVWQVGVTGNGSVPSASNGSMSYFSGTPSIDTWYHVVASYDKNATPQIRLWIDGTELTDTVVSNNVVEPYSSTSSVIIGGIANGSAVEEDLDGKVDDFRQLSRLPNTGEIDYYLLNHANNVTFGSEVTSLLVVQDSEILATSESVQLTQHSTHSPNLFCGYVENVSTDAWTTVTLPYSYTSMVVVCTPKYPYAGEPLFPRIQSASGNSFQVRAQRGDDTGDTDSCEMHYLVVEEGVYTAANHGIDMSAVRYTSTVTDSAASWVGEEQTYQNAYTTPRVLGQVLTYNNTKNVTFWARGGSAATDPPDAFILWTGKTVSQNVTDTIRVDETIGYIVSEQGAWLIDGIWIESGITSELMGGDNISPATKFTFSNLGRYTSLVMSPAGLNGTDGGWPRIVSDSVENINQWSGFFQEDKYFDPEIQHVYEEVAYFGTARVYNQVVQGAEISSTSDNLDLFQTHSLTVQDSTSPLASVNENALSTFLGDWLPLPSAFPDNWQYQYSQEADNGDPSAWLDMTLQSGLIDDEWWYANSTQWSCSVGLATIDSQDIGYFNPYLGYSPHVRFDCPVTGNLYVSVKAWMDYGGEAEIVLSVNGVEQASSIINSAYPTQEAAWEAELSYSATAGDVIALSLVAGTSAINDRTYFTFEIYEADLSLFQTYSLLVDGSESLVESENIALIQTHSLAAQDSENLVESENIALTQTHSLAAQDSESLVESENITLTQTHSLVIQDSESIVESGDVALIPQGSLGVQYSRILVESENIALTQTHSLAVQDSESIVESENITLTRVYPLIIQDSESLVESENITLTQTHSLTVDDSESLVESENTALSQIHSLAVQDSESLVESENITLSKNTVVVAANSECVVDSENIVFTQNHILLVDDSECVVGSENINFTSSVLLIHHTLLLAV